jgi:hypothetical protein
VIASLFSYWTQDEKISRFVIYGESHGANILYSEQLARSAHCEDNIKRIEAVRLETILLEREHQHLQGIEHFALDNRGSAEECISIFIERPQYIGPQYIIMDTDSRIRILDARYTSSIFPGIDAPRNAVYLASDFDKNNMSHIPPVHLLKARSLKDAMLKYFRYTLEIRQEPSLANIELCIKIYKNPIQKPVSPE